MIFGFSNITPDEFFYYKCTDENAVKFYEKLVEDRAKEELELRDLSSRIEAIEEQLHFGIDLVNEIEYSVNLNTRAADIKKIVRALIEESHLER